jgi:hypothetical protein
MSTARPAVRSTVRSGVLLAARAALLAGPAAIAFFSGGYFPAAQAWAGLAAWVLVAVAVAADPRALPSSRDSWLAVGGLALLGFWTLLSITWAPIAGNAYHAGQLVMLYVGVLLAATALLRGRAVRRSVEPALAAGVLVVVVYGIAERLLPGLLHYAHSISAQGRLEQPLTYWNAMGELAALGFVLSAAIAGDRARSAMFRAAAAAAAAPLGLGLYLSFSRGALFACVAGLVALTVAVPRREQLSATLRAIGFAALAVASAATFRGVTSLAGSPGTREREGAIVLAALVVLIAVAAFAQRVSERRGLPGGLRLPPRAPLIATGVIAAGLAFAIIVGAHETRGTPVLSGGATRLASLQSNRYAYWSVALRAFSSEPLRGVGAGGWSVDWLRWRTIGAGAQDAHSLELQTLAELGLVGLALLLSFLTGVALSARRALRAGAAVAGAVAALVCYLAHSPLDWDWQMPAVTLVALVLAGALLAEGEQASGSTEAPRDRYAPVDQESAPAPTSA